MAPESDEEKHMEYRKPVPIPFKPLPDLRLDYREPRVDRTGRHGVMRIATWNVLNRHEDNIERFAQSCRYQYMEDVDVAMLQELCAESAIGSSADILEEDADKLVADAMTLLRIHRELSRESICYIRLLYHFSVLKDSLLTLLILDFLLYISDISLQISLILRQLPAVFLCFLSQSLMPGTDIVQMNGRNLEVVTLYQFTIDGSRIALPEDFICRSFQRIFLEGAEVLVGMNVSFAFLRLQIKVEGSIFHLIGSHITDILLLHDRIILWSPGYEIFRISYSKLW